MTVRDVGVIDDNRDKAGRLFGALLAALNLSQDSLVTFLRAFVVLGLVGAVVWFVRWFWISGGHEVSARSARVLQLATEIAAWLKQRAMEEQTIGFDPQGHARLRSEAMTDYSTRFAARVIHARDDLARIGLTDAELDRSYRRPANLIGVSTVHERLGALAHRLAEASPQGQPFNQGQTTLVLSKAGESKVLYRYISASGDFYEGIPARDLSEADYQAMSDASKTLVDNGKLYVRVN